MQLYYLLMLVVGAAVVQGKKYCNSDDDCTELGDLICMKSQCALGVCGCPRGEAAVFLGSKNKYSCVKLRRVGESCSEDGDGDMCGAVGSECKEGKCVCSDDGDVPLRNGELCGDASTRYPGETCTPDLDCREGTTCQSESPNTDDWYGPVQYNVPTCACDNDETLTITNTYSTSRFAGSAYPRCVDKKLGDSCHTDDDCGNIVGTAAAECIGTTDTNKVCTCPTGHTNTNYERSTCRNTAGLGFGESCSAFNDNCDGSKGLKCDVCAIDQTQSTCACGPQHTLSGSNTCNPIGLEGTCHGDYNCKGFSPRGICVDGKCKNAGLQLSASIGGVLTMLAFALLHNLTL